MMRITITPPQLTLETIIEEPVIPRLSSIPLRFIPVPFCLSPVIQPKINIDTFEQVYSDIECSICLERGTNIKTKCNHYYHRDCLKQIIKPSCPMCRQKL
jgi:hypothetical protein